MGTPVTIQSSWMTMAYWNPWWPGHPPWETPVNHLPGNLAALVAGAFLIPYGLSLLFMGFLVLNPLLDLMMFTKVVIAWFFCSICVHEWWLVQSIRSFWWLCCTYSAKYRKELVVCIAVLNWSHFNSYSCWVLHKVPMRAIWRCWICSGAMLGDVDEWHSKAVWWLFFTWPISNWVATLVFAKVLFHLELNCTLSVRDNFPATNKKWWRDLADVPFSCSL